MTSADSSSPFCRCLSLSFSRIPAGAACLSFFPDSGPEAHFPTASTPSCSDPLATPHPALSVRETSFRDLLLATSLSTSAPAMAQPAASRTGFGGWGGGREAVPHSDLPDSRLSTKPHVGGNQQDCSQQLHPLIWA